MRFWASIRTTYTVNILSNVKCVKVIYRLAEPVGIAPTVDRLMSCPLHSMGNTKMFISNCLVSELCMFCDMACMINKFAIPGASKWSFGVNQWFCVHGARSFPFIFYQQCFISLSFCFCCVPRVWCTFYLCVNQVFRLTLSMFVCVESYEWMKVWL